MEMLGYSDTASSRCRRLTRYLIPRGSLLR
uniref:Uncharacterized protein n=1 Tax=Arundo donax TaxID=35708 RepID=A0A0A8ZE77_ARUDO